MSFATSINCIDGRVQSPIAEYIRKARAVNFVDVITIPGCDKVFAGLNDNSALDLIKRSIEISITKHGSKFVYVSGHDDCAANPVDRNTHIEHIKEAVALISSWNLDVQVIGLWVDQNLQVEEIT